jgi:hypothetical protein
MGAFFAFGAGMTAAPNVHMYGLLWLTYRGLTHMKAYVGIHT